MLTATEIHEIAGHLVTGDEVAAMRFWIADSPDTAADCDDVADLGHSQVVAGIEQHYPGGVREFLARLHAELEG